MARSGAASEATTPVQLPLVTDRPERGDAAANRQRILAVARELLEKHGASGVSMDAVAAAAGVGKGTVFRRFGDRAGLMGELISDYMRDFQDAFLFGPPPLGPGAPPADRLIAFVTGLIELQREHLPIALAGEASLPEGPDRVQGALRFHVATLIYQVDPGLDSELLASMVLGAIAPNVLNRVGSNADTIVAAITKLLSGITGPTNSRTDYRTAATGSR
jgi:AcrR family transcriptional regulator